MGKIVAAITGLVALVMGIFSLMVLAVVGFGLYFAWAGSVLYNWFIPTAFPFMPVLGVIQTWGIMVMLNIFFWRPSNTDKTYWTSAFLAPIVAVGIGYVIQRFFM